jgi:hypothetical protein
MKNPNCTNETFRLHISRTRFAHIENKDCITSGFVFAQLCNLLLLLGVITLFAKLLKKLAEFKKHN